MAAQKIAFIGLGQMGRHMASNLLKAGHSLIVCDASPAAVEAFTRAHPTASVAATPGAAAATPGATAVITMLPSSPHVRACYEEGGSRGIFGAARPGTLLVDCSTINPGVAASVGGAAAARGLAFVDAPVSGGVGGAEAGTLTFMVGGPAPAFAAAKPLLGAMGRNIVHVGGPGAGCAAKLCNNLVLGASMLAVAEAMQLGKRLGVDAGVLAGIINTSSGKCWSSEVRAARGGRPEGGWSFFRANKPPPPPRTPAGVQPRAGRVPLRARVARLRGRLCGGADAQGPQPRAGGGARNGRHAARHRHRVHVVLARYRGHGQERAAKGLFQRVRGP
jgi:3-hydroxyisobutyrate dehydrogenase